MPEPVLPASLHPRGHTADPPFALVISPVQRVGRCDQRQERRLLAALLDIGFSPVAGPDGPLPRVAGLTAYRVGGDLNVHDAHCDALFRIDVRRSSPECRHRRWPRAIATGRRIGLVFPAEFIGSGPAIGGTLALAGRHRLRVHPAPRTLRSSSLAPLGCSARP
ncbi:MAG: hypothetical protein JXA67_18650 [Micromonosporaceae bacterium]|nr:hypothetical protein [Micromonosporaceae bacterium]